MPVRLVISFAIVLAVLSLVLNISETQAAQTCHINTSQVMVCIIKTSILKRRGSWLGVPDLMQPKVWPLGNPSIRSCRHCLQPSRLNAMRLKALRNQP